MAFSRCNGNRNEEEGWLVGRRCQWMDGASEDDREEQTFMCASYLIQSVANKLHHLTKTKGKCCLFEARRPGMRMKNG